MMTNFSSATNTRGCHQSGVPQPQAENIAGATRSSCSGVRTPTGSRRASLLLAQVPRARSSTLTRWCHGGLRGSLDQSTHGHRDRPVGRSLRRRIEPRNPQGERPARPYIAPVLFRWIAPDTTLRVPRRRRLPARRERHASHGRPAGVRARVDGQVRSRAFIVRFASATGTWSRVDWRSSQERPALG